MNILIYDNSINDINQLKKCIDCFFTSINEPYTIQCCQSSNELFSTIHLYDLLFLDIELSNENGIDLGMQLKNKKFDCIIIITTHFMEYAIDGYKINAERYFIKPIDQSEFNLEMTSIIHKYHNNLLGFYDSKISKNKIHFKNILYFEFFNRKTIIHLINNKTIETAYPLKHWIQITKDTFFSQPHKSFLINLNYISALKKNDIIMFNDDLIPLSRHFKTSFLKEYENNLHEVI